MSTPTIPTVPVYPGDLPPQPPVSQPPRKPRKLLAAAAVLALVAGAGIAGALAGSHGSPVPAAPAPAATAAAPATSAPSAPVLSLGQQELNWYAATGKTDATTLENDMGSIASFADAGNLPALEGEGGTLTQDATTALNDPPPVNPAGWDQAMTHWAQAGTDLTAGDLAGADTELAAGTAAFQAWSNTPHADGS